MVHVLEVARAVNRLLNFQMCLATNVEKQNEQNRGHRAYMANLPRNIFIVMLSIADVC